MQFGAPFHPLLTFLSLDIWVICDMVREVPIVATAGTSAEYIAIASRYPSVIKIGDDDEREGGGFFIMSKPNTMSLFLNIGDSGELRYLGGVKLGLS